MKSLKFFWRSLLVVKDQVVTVIEHSPYLAEESVNTIDSLCIPWLRLLKRAEEHLVKSQSISTVCITYHIRIDNVEH